MGGCDLAGNTGSGTAVIVNTSCKSWTTTVLLEQCQSTKSWTRQFLLWSNSCFEFMIRSWDELAIDSHWLCGLAVKRCGVFADHSHTELWGVVLFLCCSMICLYSTESFFFLSSDLVCCSGICISAGVIKVHMVTVTTLNLIHHSLLSAPPSTPLNSTHHAIISITTILSLEWVTLLYHTFHRHAWLRHHFHTYSMAVPLVHPSLWLLCTPWTPTSRPLPWTSHSIQKTASRFQHGTWHQSMEGLANTSPVYEVTPLEHQENCFDPRGASYIAEVFAIPSVVWCKVPCWNLHAEDAVFCCCFFPPFLPKLIVDNLIMGRNEKVWMVHILFKC